MKLAILFWFYKEPEVCISRLRLIKQHNPGIPIYGLFGGEQGDEAAFRSALAPYLDDFHRSPDHDSYYKWIHGDLMLLDWYQTRSKELPWDTIAILQWDMLVFDSLENQFPGIQKGQIFLSGLRTLDPGLEGRWVWTKPGGRDEDNFRTFTEHVKTAYNYHDQLMACLFILELLPREFFERYGAVPDKELGMLEYKVPTYAKAWKLPFYERDLGVYWAERGDWQDFPLNAMGKHIISKQYVQTELDKPHGWRIFHPYHDPWPED